MTNLSYDNSAALKAELVAEMRAHQAADRLAQGVYLTAWGGRPTLGGTNTTGWRGCAVGCAVAGRLLPTTPTGDIDEMVFSLDLGWHQAWADVTGLPVWLAYLDDVIFEQLYPVQAREWPLRLLEAVPVGVDLEPALAALLDELDPDGDFPNLRDDPTSAEAECDFESLVSYRDADYFAGRLLHHLSTAAPVEATS